jgi:hypothetical protein
VILAGAYNVERSAVSLVSKTRGGDVRTAAARIAEMVAVLEIVPNKSLQATRDGGFSSASRFTLVGPACLSFGR